MRSRAPVRRIGVKATPIGCAVNFSATQGWSFSLTAKALAGTGMNSASLKLIDGLVTLVDREIAANPTSPPPKGADEKTILACADRQYRHKGLTETRKSLLVARVAAGGDRQ